MQHERRRHPRLEIPLETTIRIQDSERELSVTMEDLSAGGAGLLTTFEIPVGTEITQVSFELPAMENTAATQLELAARVARSEQLAGVGGELVFHTGLQFVDITQEIFDRIQKFVFQRLRSDQKERVPLERSIAIRFDRFDDFVDEVSVNLSTTGMFIRTRDPRPPGSVFNFQFQLGEDFSLIEGRAEVVWRRRHAEGPDKLPGMGVKFVNLDVDSQRLIERLVSQRQEVDGTISTESSGAAAPATTEVSPPADSAAKATSSVTAEETASPPVATAPEAADPARIAAFQAVAGKLKEDLDTARQTHAQEMDELRARMEDQQAAARSELEERLRDAETAHKELDRHRGELEEARTSLQREVKEAREQARALQARLEASASPEEFERLTEERTALEQAHAELTATRGDLAQALEAARAEATELRAELEDRPTQEELQRLTTESDSLAATNTRLLADLDGATDEADELRRLLEDRTAESEVERLTDERTELRAAQEEIQAAHDQTRRELAQTQGVANELRAELEARLSPEEAERLAGERDELQTAHDEIRQELARVRQETEELRSELESRPSSERIEQLESERDALREERDQARDAAEGLAGRETVEEELEAARQELAAVRERQQALSAELAVLRHASDPPTAATEEEPDPAQADTRHESERLREELSAAEESRWRLESELHQAPNESRQAAQHAEEREVALRAELENATLAAGGEPTALADRSRGGRRVATTAALLLVGALAATLAVTFLEPVSSLLDRWRPTGEPPPTIGEAAPSEISAEDTPSPTVAGEPTPMTAAEPAPPPAAAPGEIEPEPAPEPPSGPDLEAAEQAAQAWASAWSDQRVDDYLASYAIAYQPPDGQSRESWAATRRQRIQRPRSIEVRLESPRTVELAADRVSVSFDQAYSSDNYSDQVRKTLVMVLEDGAWKIAEERVIE